MSADAASAEAAPPPVAFTGDRRELLGIVLTNTALNLLTLGIYRFWAVTNLRRFYWRNTSVDGDPFEYTGTGLELLLGAVIVLAVIFGFTLLLQVSGGIAANLTSLIILLYPLAVWRARRYRLARTRWRGIRFSQQGGQWAYTVKFYGWYLLTTLTLGIAYPFLRRHRHGALLAAMSFGNQPARFAGNGSELLQPWLAANGIYVAFFSLFLFLVFGPALFAPQAAESPVQEVLSLLETQNAFAIFTAYILLTVLVVMTLLVYYRVREFQFFARHLRIGELHFWAWLNLKPIIFLYLRYLAILLLPLILFVGVAVYAFFDLVAAGSTEGGNFDQFASFAVIAFFVFAVLFFLFQSVVRHVFWIAPLLAYGAGRVAIGRFDEVERIQQSASQEIERGEGLAEALDIDAGF